MKKPNPGEQWFLTEDPSEVVVILDVSECLVDFKWDSEDGTDVQEIESFMEEFTRKKKYYVWMYQGRRTLLTRIDGVERKGNPDGWDSYQAARKWALKNIPGDFEILNDSRSRSRPQNSKKIEIGGDPPKMASQ